jgi:hypothetical protein
MSHNSSFSAGDGDIDSALRRADEALSSVDKILKGVGETTAADEVKKVTSDSVVSAGSSECVGKSEMVKTTQTAAKLGKENEVNRDSAVTQDLGNSGAHGNRDPKISPAQKLAGGSDSSGFQPTTAELPANSPSQNSVTPSPKSLVRAKDDDSVFLDDTSASKAGGNQTAQSASGGGGGSASGSAKGGDGSVLGSGGATEKTMPSSMAPVDSAAALAAAEQSLNSLKEKHGSVKKEDSVDDFYSKFDAPLSPDFGPQTPVLTNEDRPVLSRQEGTEDRAIRRQLSSTGSAGRIFHLSFFFCWDNNHDKKRYQNLSSMKMSKWN